MTTDTSKDEAQLTIAKSELSGKYFVVTKFHKDGRAKEKFDVTDQLQRLIAAERLDELKKIDEELTYELNPYAQELTNDRYDGDSIIRDRIAELEAQLKGPTE